MEKSKEQLMKEALNTKFINIVFWLWTLSILTVISSLFFWIWTDGLAIKIFFTGLISII